jgi:hypothetical protein
VGTNAYIIAQGKKESALSYFAAAQKRGIDGVLDYIYLVIPRRSAMS